MKAVLTLLCVAALSAPVFATLGIDLSSPCSADTYHCLRGEGYSFAVPRVWQSNGVPDPNGGASIDNAWNGGMAHVDGYMFPCPTCGNPAGQVADCVNRLRNAGVKFGMIWFDIEGPQYWMGQSANRAFFNGMVSQARSMGVNLGIYSSASQWDPIFGSDFTGGSAFPIWYAHYDGNPSFSDWVPFGGWRTPAIKQFEGTNYVCGQGIDKDWYPDGSREQWPEMWPLAFNHSAPLPVQH